MLTQTATDAVLGEYIFRAENRGSTFVQILFYFIIGISIVSAYFMLLKIGFGVPTSKPSISTDAVLSEGRYEIIKYRQEEKRISDALSDIDVYTTPNPQLFAEYPKTAKISSI